MAFSIEDYKWPAFGDRKPFEHQKKTVLFLLKNKLGCMVLNDMGTGKTLSAIWTCDILFTAKKIRKVLIIGPLSTMKSVWFNEIMMNTPHLRAIIAHGGPIDKRKQIIHSPSAQIVIINHDGIKTMEDDIIREEFDIIIIDEGTAFKANSERTKCMKRIADAQRKRTRQGGVWLMTGELTPNAPTEAFYPAQIAVPFNKWLPRYFGQFRDACMYQAPHNDFMWFPKPEAAQVVAMVCQPSIRFTREQCLDLPDTTYQTLEVPLTADQRTWYEKMRKEAIISTTSGDVSAANSAVLLNKLLQISAGAVKNNDGVVLEIGCEDRFNQLVEIFEETPQRKLVVFATYRATIEMLVRDLTKKGIKVAAIHGDVPQAIRGSLIDRFQRGDLEILVLQPQSAAHGITLTAASTIVWFSLIPSNEYYQQGNARIVRAGQTRKTLIVMFTSTKAEKHIAKILETKGRMSDEVQRIFAEQDL